MSYFTDVVRVTVTSRAVPEQRAVETPPESLSATASWRPAMNAWKMPTAPTDVSTIRTGTTSVREIVTAVGRLVTSSVAAAAEPSRPSPGAGPHLRPFFLPEGIPHLGIVFHGVGPGADERIVLERIVRRGYRETARFIHDCSLLQCTRMRSALRGRLVVGYTQFRPRSWPFISTCMCGPCPGDHVQTLTRSQLRR